MFRGLTTRLTVETQHVAQDVRQGVRMLMRSPGHTVAVTALLSLTIGAATAMFSLMEAVLLRPLPYKDPERLCVLWKSIPQRSIEWDWTSAPAILDWSERNQTLEEVALVLRPEGSQVSLDGGEGRERLRAAIVSGNFFHVLGVAPALGRAFSAEESRAGENVAVLSHDFWRSRFGSDPGAVGRTLRLDGRETTIIGVMPASFAFPDKQSSLWLPLTADPRWASFQQPRFRIADAFFGLGRLRSGMTIAHAREDLAAVAKTLASAYPATDAGLGIRVVPLSEQLVGPRTRASLWALTAAVSCVLLIAWFNLSGLAIARGISRENEFAVRAALGASRGQIVRQLLAENLALAALAGMGGAAFAWVSLTAFLVLVPADLPLSGEIAPSTGIVLALTAMPALAVAWWPAIPLAGRYGASFGERSGTGSAKTHRMRRLLVAAQLGLALVLLTGAGLLLRSSWLLDAIDRGFDGGDLLTVSVSLPSGRYTDAGRIQGFFDGVIARIEALPGVRGAAVGPAVSDSFRGNAPNQSIATEGSGGAPIPALHSRMAVSEEYFRVLGITRLRGRLFDTGDRQGTPMVAIVNEEMARQFWPSEDAAGKRFREMLPGMEGSWIQVIGVVKNVIYNRDGIVVPTFYVSTRQTHYTEHNLIVRAASGMDSLAGLIRREFQAADPMLPPVAVEPVQRRLAEQDRPRRFQTQLIGMFGAVSLPIAAMGLYGMIAYWVESRKREIGVRMALGATRLGVALFVLRHSMAVAGMGLVIGAIGSKFLGQALSGYLFGIAPTDPFTFLCAAGSLGGIVLIASLIPAIRAAQTDPMTAIRHE